MARSAYPSPSKSADVFDAPKESSVRGTPWMPGDPWFHVRLGLAVMPVCEPLTTCPAPARARSPTGSPGTPTARSAHPSPLKSYAVALRAAATGVAGVMARRATASAVAAVGPRTFRAPTFRLRRRSRERRLGLLIECLLPAT